VKCRVDTRPLLSAAPQIISAALQIISAGPHIISAAPQMISPGPQIISAGPQIFLEKIIYVMFSAAVLATGIPVQVFQFTNNVQNTMNGVLTTGGEGAKPEFLLLKRDIMDFVSQKRRSKYHTVNNLPGFLDVQNANFFLYFFCLQILFPQLFAMFQILF
jgi:hypothetical protein